jgi:hypothetical protein
LPTSWTECLALLNKSQETVIAALKRAQHLLPFAMQGIDTDNGSEFIKVELLTFCEQEQLTITLGRPRHSNDQCYVEQKNGQSVRQVVGYDRFVGELAYRQLDSTVPSAAALRQLFSTLHEVADQAARRQQAPPYL